MTSKCQRYEIYRKTNRDKTDVTFVCIGGKIDLSCYRFKLC